MESTKEHEGKLAVITGANSGIGLEASHQLVNLGIQVVMCCRSLERAEEARQQILNRDNNVLSKSDIEKNLHIVQLDLADLDNIQSFRSRYNALPVSGLAVDILILNAGVVSKFFVLSHHVYVSF